MYIFYYLPGTFCSSYTVLKHNVKRIFNDGIRIQDVDKIHRMAWMWLV